MPRKLISICVTHNSWVDERKGYKRHAVNYYGVADDGTLWRKTETDEYIDEWEQLETIPED
jgi:hypothetical protein